MKQSSSLAIRQRIFKGADIRRICAITLGKKQIHSHSWVKWHKWIDGILKEKSGSNHYWVNGDRAILLLSIALNRKTYPRKELHVSDVRSKESEASAVLSGYLKYFDCQFVVGREVQELLEIKGKKRSWNTIRKRIPDFSYTTAYRVDLVMAMVS